MTKNNKKRWPAPDTHPPSEMMLLALEGELSARDMAIIAEHLKVCWECRTQSDQLHDGIFAFMTHRRTEFVPRIAPPPSAWRTFRPRLMQVVAECGSAPLGIRLLATLRSTPFFSAAARPAWITLAVLLPLLLWVWMGRLRNPPAVSAAEVLRRAGQSRQIELRAGKEVIYQKLRIRSGGKSLIRELLHGNSAEHAAIPVTLPTADVAERNLAHLFQASGLNWADPLSAEAFAAWRDSLGRKRDEVTSDDGRITVTTTSLSNSLLQEGAIAVRAFDWHPVEERFRLRDDEVLEITELAFEVRPQTPEPPTQNLLGRAQQTEPTPASAIPSARQLSASEMEVRAVLHQAGADLGEQLEISRDARGFVKVEGTVSDEHKAVLSESLEAIPHVRVNLQSVEEVAVGEPMALPDAPATSASALRPLLEPELQKQLPVPPDREALVNRAISLSQEALMQAWALRRLKERYGQREEGQLDTDSRKKLHSMLADHARSLQEQVNQSETLLVPILTSVAEVEEPPLASNPAESNPPSWQARASRIFSAAHQMDRLTTRLLIGSDDFQGDAAGTARELMRLYRVLESESPQLASQVEPIKEHK